MKLSKSVISTCLGLLLVSCHDHTQLAEGGITGSGISVGPITAFGSIWMGGVRYDTSNAEFIRNGKTSSLGQTDFNVGEIVNIVGSVNADGLTGIAKKVEFDRNLSGPVTAISLDGKTLSILGQQVTTDVLTLFSGFNTLNELALSNFVEISGSRTPEGHWIASTIKLIALDIDLLNSMPELEVEGRISDVNGTQQIFKVGNLTINYGQSILNGVTDFTQSAGQYIEIKSNQNLINGSQLIATMIEPKDEYPKFAPDSYTKLDGRITDFSSAQVFEVNEQAIIVDETTVLVNGDASDFGLNAHLGVQGLINANGMLAADKIIIRQSADPSKTVMLKATIEAIDTQASELKLLSSTIVVDNTAIILSHHQDGAQAINFTDLMAGDFINVTGRKIAQNKLIALRIDRNPISEATPTPAPETTPTPAPEATPTPAPEATPTPAPEATPTPAPEATPTPAPEATPTPAPEATSTPAPEATSTPAPTDDTESSRITGLITNVDTENFTFVIDNLNIATNADTRLLHPDFEERAFDATDFFQIIQNNEKTAVVRGYSLDNGWLKAVRVRLLKD